ncbi:MAG: Uma2 family endonuclease, partial [Kutzneria sp.]|nr:Uma2 family endonuclease [Kutzneria sp.]
LIWGYWVASPTASGPHQYASDELRMAIKDALRAAGRSDLYAVTAIATKISTALRTGLIPDVAVLNSRPIGVSFPPEALELVVEVWSPGNTRSERDTKMAAYAGAGVPFLWTVDQAETSVVLTTYRLESGRYVRDLRAGTGERVRITAAPVPVEVGLDDLLP